MRKIEIKQGVAQSVQTSVEKFLEEQVEEYGIERLNICGSEFQRATPSDIKYAVRTGKPVNFRNTGIHFKANEIEIAKAFLEEKRNEKI